MTIGGTLPRRKPGTLICWAIFLYAASRLGLSSSKGTSTVSLARGGVKFSTALFPGGLLNVLIFPRGARNGVVVGGAGAVRLSGPGLRAAYWPRDTPPKSPEGL